MLILAFSRFIRNNAVDRSRHDGRLDKAVFEGLIKFVGKGGA